MQQPPASSNCGARKLRAAAELVGRPQIAGRPAVIQIGFGFEVKSDCSQPADASRWGQRRVQESPPTNYIRATTPSDSCMSEEQTLTVGRRRSCRARTG